jgi:sugar diacid utilization regulator
MTGTRSRPTSKDIIEIVKRLEPRLGPIAQAITQEIWAEIPGYRALEDESAREEVAEAAQRNLTAFLRALGEGHDLPKRDIDALAVVGETRAHQGIPIEDVLKAFRTVGRVLWDHLSEELTGPSAPPVDVSIELSRNLMKFTDQISSAVAFHYSNAQRAIVRQQEAARREFLHDLLLGTYSSPDEMVKRARAFGYDLARPQVGVVALHEGASDPGRDELSMSRALDNLVDKLKVAGQPMVDRRAGKSVGVFAIAPGADSDLQRIGKLLSEELGEGWLIGLGGPHGGLEGCRRSYSEAHEALEIGHSLNPDRGIYPADDFLLYRFLRLDLDLAARFVDEVVGPVIEHDERRRSELIKTLQAYFDTDGSAKESGGMLYAHPHTVTYRLKQIEKLTGRSLRDPEDKLHLHLAVKALRLLQGSNGKSEKGAPIE